MRISNDIIFIFGWTNLLLKSDTASRNATWISVTQGESYTSVQRWRLYIVYSQMIQNTVKMGAVVGWVHASACFGEKRTLSWVPKKKGPCRLSSTTGARANICHGVGMHQYKQNGWLACVWRGTIDVEKCWYWGLYRDIYCHQDDIFPGKQDHARPHSARSKTEWFLDTLKYTIEWMCLTDLQSCLLLKRRSRQRTPQTVEQLTFIRRDWAKLKKKLFSIHCIHILKTFKSIIQSKHKVNPNYFGMCCSHQTIKIKMCLYLQNTLSWSVKTLKKKKIFSILSVK